MHRLKQFLLLVVLALSSFVTAQTLSSTLDKKTLSLGEAGVYRIHISNLQGKDVLSAPKNELLPFHFEEIKDDITKKQDSYDRVIEFAVFEEGTFKIPAFDIKIGGQLYQTVPYEIEVINTAQKGEEINDIFQNKELEMGIKDYWELYKWYVLGVLGAIALIIAVIFILKYGRKPKDSPTATTNKTLKELELLRKKKYIEKGDFRAFYVELIDISREFLTRQYRVPANVLLTDDLIDVLKKHQLISIENEKVVEEVFQRGDMVKFAKTFPDQKTMEDDFTAVQNFVKRSIKDLELENLR